MPFAAYMQGNLDATRVEPGTVLEAGAHVSVTITYTAGKFGIDDTGALKFSWRTASDCGKPQFSDPKAPNYTTVEASNGAALHLEHNRNNIRPWVNTLFVRVMDGFLREATGSCCASATPERARAATASRPAATRTSSSGPSSTPFRRTTSCRSSHRRRFGWCPGGWLAGRPICRRCAPSVTDSGSAMVAGRSWLSHHSPLFFNCMRNKAHFARNPFSLGAQGAAWQP